eukprot:gene10021-2340_t
MKTTKKHDKAEIAKLQTGYKIPEYIPFPFKNEKRWKESMEIVKTEIKTFEDLKKTCSNCLRFEIELDVLSFVEENMTTKEKKEFYENTIPFLQNLVLKTEKLFPNDIPMLIHSKENEISFTREQCACIIANSFFGTFERSSDEQLWGIYQLPSINLDDLFDGKANFGAKVAKIKMFLNYFERISKSMPKGNVQFIRKCLNKPHDFSKSNKKFKMATVLSEGVIEDCMDGLQADFANAFIGGACISYGCVQEEILFSTNPECICSRLFTPVMQSTETVVIKGAEKFSSYKGYAFSLEYGGNFYDQNIDEKGFNLNQTVAMDARIYIGKPSVQWEEKEIERETIKSFVAFSKNDYKKVATGNWGCGAFQGDKHLKSMIQWISATEADQEMFYYTFRDEKLSSDIKGVMKYVIEKNIAFI